MELLRELTKTILTNQKDGFIQLILGPRRVGKTILLKQLLNNFPNKKSAIFNGDTEETRQFWKTTSEIRLDKLTQNLDVIIIDEAQRIPDITLALKIIIDKYPEKKIFVTGSFALELITGFSETLTGRVQRYYLYPLSTKEISSNLAPHQIPFLLEDQLIFGGYPYLTHLSNNEDKKQYLKSIIDDYLFRDLFQIETIKNKDTIKKLATLLAHQIGNEVSLNELARQLLIDVKTVARYLNLLEACFLIIGLGAYSTNLRKEIVKSKKYYFYDLGIRNALLQQFQPLDYRYDIGQLWENFLAIERIKKFEYSKKIANYYFWRTYTQAEVDWLEQTEAGLNAYEFKWKKTKARTPKQFLDNYKTQVNYVNPENYLEFII
ncbi:MAG: ATP-binding protein [Candidatus Margulisiibacteriota bacterium]|jgi:hypothetical protein